MKQGDRNIAFFHQFATARRKKNIIKKLKGGNNDWVEGTENLKPLIFQYFSHMFTSEVQDTDPAVLDKILPKVSLSSYEKLLDPFSQRPLDRMVFMLFFIRNSGIYVERKLHKKFFKQ